MTNLKKKLENMTKGALAGVALLTALPLFGAVGALTAVGAAVGALVGAGVALADDLMAE